MEFFYFSPNNHYHGFGIRCLHVSQIIQVLKSTAFALSESVIKMHLHSFFLLFFLNNGIIKSSYAMYQLKCRVYATQSVTSNTKVIDLLSQYHPLVGDTINVSDVAVITKCHCHTSLTNVSVTSMCYRHCQSYLYSQLQLISK